MPITTNELLLELQMGLHAGWERVRSGNNQAAYEGLFSWLKDHDFYETSYRNVIPNPAYDNGVKDLGYEFMKVLTINGLGIEGIFPGDFGNSIEVEDGDKEERVFQLYILNGRERVYRAKLRFPHSHDKFSFTEVPILTLEAVDKSSLSMRDILALKYPDKEYRLFKNNLLLQDDEGKMILHSPKQNEIVNVSSQKVWLTDCNAFIVIPKNEYYNFVIMERGDSLEYYINIASPILADENKVSYIDLDIDVTFTDADYTPIVLDEDEFLENSKRYNYTDKQKNEVSLTLEKIKTAILKKEHPFDLPFYNYCKILFSHAIDTDR